MIGTYIASQKIKEKGYEGLGDFVYSYSSNYFSGMKAEPEKISIEIKDKDLKILRKNREQALERGVIINDLDGDYVSATLEYKGEKIKVKLRLKGHMTDHLQNDKWSFRIKIKDKKLFMGMKRFSIQHPGTRGYIYEWIYHELMQRENVIALRYKFINVSVNGKDWGIYAVEENFESELLENNQREKGPILRFNPDMYWVNRYNMIKKEYAPDEFASYYSANPEAYREENILSDSTQYRYYMSALSLIEGVRNKAISIDQAFDIKQLARFHAIIDLVGGQHSIDWSDIKYYYNPLKRLLEPVAYESFTTFPIKSLSGMYKFTQLEPGKNYYDWHTAIFSNPAFFSAYVQELEKVSSSEYLDDFFENIDVKLEENLNILFKEYPYKKFDKQTYYRNQQLIKKMLDPPKQFHAYFDHVTGDSVCIKIGSIESLPSELKAIHIGELKISLSPAVIIPSKKENDAIAYKEYYFVLPSKYEWKNKLADSIKIIYCLLGSSKEKQERVFSFPHPTIKIQNSPGKTGNMKLFSFLIINEEDKSILIKQGKQRLSQTLIIPAGYKVCVSPGLVLDLINNSELISFSPMYIPGSADVPVLIQSSDSTGKGIQIISNEKSQLEHVFFTKTVKGISFSGGTVVLNYCSFAKIQSDPALQLTQTNFKITGCLFQQTVSNALVAQNSEGNIQNSVFENCSGDAVQVLSSIVSVKYTYIKNSRGNALNASGASQVNGEGIKINKALVGISGGDLSIINLKNVTIFDSEKGIEVRKTTSNAGQTRISLVGLELKGVKVNYNTSEKLSILVNNKSV